jgi:hypothetical protein
MSALSPKSDIDAGLRHVRYGPIADKAGLDSRMLVSASSMAAGISAPLIQETRKRYETSNA